MYSEFITNESSGMDLPSFVTVALRMLAFPKKLSILLPVKLKSVCRQTKDYLLINSTVLDSMYLPSQKIKPGILLLDPQCHEGYDSIESLMKSHR
jgi:hypothetical protein